MRLRRFLARAAVVALTASTVATTVGPSPAAAGGGVAVRQVKGGLRDPAAFTFTPSGYIFYLERGTGEIRVLRPGTGADTLFFKISGVNGAGERGALGIALDPNWPSVPFVYVYVTRQAQGSLRNQILRIRAHNGHGTGLQVLLQTRASGTPYHNGGRILFGPGGNLYAMVGEGHTPANAQDLTGNNRGKILRMKSDGSIPAGNPIPGSRIWSFGLRNSFGFTVDPQTGRIWETENGPSCNDEINLIVKGGNFGWGPSQTCSGTGPENTNNSGPAPRLLPEYWTQSTLGITGAAFCAGCDLGAQYKGDLFFGGANDGQLRVLQLNAARNGVVGGALVLLTSPNHTIYSMETSPSGAIYFSDAQSIFRLVAA